MNILNNQEYVKTKLRRKATTMQIGGVKPTGGLEKSWFGRVNLALPYEEWPNNNDKQPMHALCQINVTHLPYKPDLLKDIELITLFINSDVLPFNDENGVKWCLRAYKNIKELIPLKQVDTNSQINQFEMIPKLVEEDYPCWDDFSNLQIKDNSLTISEEIEDDFASYFDNNAGFKIGGWPTLIQSEICWAPHNKHPIKPNYVFQIDTTKKGNWMWGDNGIGYFGKGTKEGFKEKWAIEWQCL